MNWYIFAKNDSTPKDYLFSAELKNNDGYIYLSVENSLVTAFLKMIDSEKVIHPKEVSDKYVGAHITVMRSEETEGLDIKEIGKKFKFTITGFHHVNPEGWDGVKKVYFLTVKSDDIENLRKKYNLTKKIKNHEFHITVGAEE